MMSFYLLIHRTVTEQSSIKRKWLRSIRPQKDQKISKERKGWSITIHDLSGSPVALASMVTPFVASPGSDSVSRSNPGAWLILRPGEGTWKPWGRLEAWRVRGSGSDSIDYRFELDSGYTADATTLANSTVSSSSGGKFTIDMASGTASPLQGLSPQTSADFGSSSSGSRPASGSGSDFGFGLIPSQVSCKGFVMSSGVKGMKNGSVKPEVEVGVQHVSCSEDAAAFVALAAAVNLSVDACRLFSQKLRKELRQ